MKKIVALALAVVVYASLTACAPGSLPASKYVDTNKIEVTKGIPREGADGLNRGYDHKKSPYYATYDYYSMKSSGGLTMLTNFKTAQQTTEWTCGPTCALMVLEWYGKRGDYNELDLAGMRQKPEPGATNLRQMINIFEAVGGFKVESTYDLENGYDDIAEDMLVGYLKRGIPVMLGTDEWGGHWQVLVGYDDMGTREGDDPTADDVIILADPYDTTDHDQDGYVIQSFERLYYNWINTFDPDFDRGVFLVAYPAGT